MKTSTPAAPGQASHDFANIPRHSRMNRFQWRLEPAALSALAVRYGVVIALLVLITAFSIAAPETFPTTVNLTSMISNNCVLAILALAVLTPLLVGEFDLSVGSVVSLTGIVAANLIGQGLAIPLVIFLAVLLGVVIGSVNAFLVTRIGLSSFVTTLATATIVAGLGQWITNNQILFKGISSNFTDLGRTKIFDIIPVQGLYVAFVAFGLWYVMARTPLGRQLLATGSGRQAARLAGIPTDRRIGLSFVICGALAGVAGVLNTAQLGSAGAGYGETLLLPAYAAAFLGATTIVVGRFNVVGTLVGIVFIAVGVTGLQLLGVSNFVSQIFNGTALIVAVSVARLGTRGKGRA